MSVSTSHASSYRNNANMTQKSSMTMNTNQHDANSSNTVILNRMSISQMRAMHAQALREAEAKQTELRLVLSSRYRELVGSSDEVLAMKDMAEELHSSVGALPVSMKALLTASNEVVPSPSETKEKGRLLRANRKKENTVLTVNFVMHQLSSLPRILHRALDKEDPFLAAIALVRIFGLMKARMSMLSENTKDSSKPTRYPLVQLLGSNRFDQNNSRFLSIQKLETENVEKYDLLLLDTQIRMVYLHVQTIPIQIMMLAKTVLLRQADAVLGPSRGSLSALALLDVKANISDENNEMDESNENHSSLANRLLDTYYDSKAKLLHRLLDELSHTSSIADQHDSFLNRSTMVSTIATKCEKIMSDIVSVIQFDVILHSHELFFSSSQSFHSFLPDFDPHVVKQKCSHFLASHIPLLRSQIRNVLVSSVSVDASMLGDIRRSLYETTTNPSNVSSSAWEEAVDSVVDARLVSPATYGASADTSTISATTMGSTSGLTENQEDSSLVTKNKSSSISTQKFSLWSALFSTTFSSLVHDLLSSSFHSVHTSTISTLLQSLSRAPRRPHYKRSRNADTIYPSSSSPKYPYSISTFTSTSLAFSSSNLLLRPHEAHRNTLLIASQLDRSLQKLSEDAHHLLVHAEEREESERRLRQSLYVQTCEIMGRLLSEIRRMIMNVERIEEDNIYGEDGDNKDEEHEDATKEMIVGRLCHLLQCKRLASLQTLLDPRNAPASTSLASSSLTVTSSMNGSLDSSINGKGSTNISTNHNRDRARGMITLDELKSAFEIADDDDDGVISFTEAVEAMGGAFSGTPFNGAEMVRSTLLITGTSGSASNANKTGSPEDMESNTLQNVTLFELGLLSAKGLRHDAEGSASAMGLVQSCLGTIVQRCFQNWARIVLSPLKFSLKVALDKQWDQGEELSDEEWRDVHHERHDQNALSPLSSSVSTHILAFLLSLSCEMNSAVCPADSIPSAISTKVLTLVEIVREALFQESIETVATIFKNRVLGNEEEEEITQDSKISISCSSQMLADLRFLRHFLVIDGSGKDGFVSTRQALNEVDTVLKSFLDQDTAQKIGKGISKNIAAIDESHLFLSNFFGKRQNAFDTGASLSTGDIGLSEKDSNNSHILLVNPLESSRRFILLPIQSEKSINDLELRTTFASNNDEAEKESESKVDSKGVGTGFGFFSSMLKKK